MDGQVVDRSLTFTVPGEPVAWARAGSNGARRYTPDKQARHKRAVQEAAWAAGALPPLAGPVAVEMTFTFGTADKRKVGRLKGTRPDVDNLVKGILDAMNGLAFVDDGQVADLRARKIYGLTPMTVVTVTPIPA